MTLPQFASRQSFQPYLSLNSLPLFILQTLLCSLLCFVQLHSSKAEGAQLDLIPISAKLLMPETALTGTDVTFV